MLHSTCNGIPLKATRASHFENALSVLKGTLDKYVRTFTRRIVLFVKT